MKLYTIKDWDERYENNRSRTVRDLQWVPTANHHDGEGYLYVMAQDNAAEVYAAWMLMLQVASRCHPRGRLVRSNGTPHTPTTLAIKTRGQKKWFESALKLLSNEDVGWMVGEEYVGKTGGNEQNVSQASVACQSPDAEVSKKEGKKERKKEGKNEAAPRAGKKLIRDMNDAEYLAYLSESEAYKGINIRREWAKAEEWCNASNRTFSRRMLVNWLNKAEKPLSANVSGQRGAKDALGRKKEVWR